ncbi:MAG: tRNA lysidine(34) synthetase TilS [Gammaproteobacteria bacterium]|nr:tRNA lysidine(34) synthetase TilS [Gammaproteobacteria bacterium]MYD01446.1 tRNA lysidine(34) synthetase TilS [Gammaproteobacteria bacterium]MYI23876.1 tRNA lysidine(34) synthetase TilS [Gammaproteobacteria bacterium]
MPEAKLKIPPTGKSSKPAIDAVLTTLAAALDRLCPHWRERPLLVAFSGGADSTALLLALHELLEESGSERLRAAHINHGLHRDSGDWAAHCEDRAQALGVPLACRAVEVRADGRGVEAAARRARYEALEALMEPGECLLTAHHQDDQWETLMLRLLRGTGIAGLAGIREKRRLGRGWLLRPLLDVPREDLRTWLDRRGENWIEDPSNRETGFDRSFLRNKVQPLLRGRWPGAAATAGRTARLAADTSGLLRDLAEHDGRGIARDDFIECQGLLRLSPARRANLLRERLAALGVAAPSEARLNAALDMLLNAAADRHPEARWGGVRLTRRRGRIYISPASDPS